MCLTCGCLLPHEDHGKPDYLTNRGSGEERQARRLDLDAAVQTLIKTVEVAKQERRTTIIAR